MKFSGTHIAIGILRITVFVLMGMVGISPTDEEIEERIKSILSARLGQDKIYAKTIVAEAFVLDSPTYGGDIGGLWHISDEGYPTLAIWKRDGSRGGYIDLRISDREVEIETAHLSGHSCQVIAAEKSSVIGVKANLFVGMKGPNSVLMATEQGSGLLTTNETGTNFYPRHIVKQFGN